MDLLLSGFEPFGGSSVNPSESAARRLHGETIGRLRVLSVILPVERERGPEALLAALATYRPDAVLCLGEASNRPVITVERVALNLLDYRIADNAGNQVVDQPVVADGPVAYFATLPVRAMRDAIRAAGVPADFSLSAGTFLCNQVMYCLLHVLAAMPNPVPAGFIHLPCLPEQAAQAGSTRPSMNLETTLTGLRAAIAVISCELEKRERAR